MCGRLNVTDDKYVVGLLDTLGVDLNLTPIRPNRFVRAASAIQIVMEQDKQRVLQKAIWWLLLEPTEDGFKPSKYTSFNTRYDKLNVPRSAGYKPFRESRCIVPARGFGETEGTGTNALYTDFEAFESAIAFGGLFREWVNKSTGECVYSCSVITLPPHDKLKPYHTKASPLMLSQDDGTMDMWLDRELKNTEVFNDLLKPKIHQRLIAQKIDKPSLYNPVGESEIICSDD